MKHRQTDQFIPNRMPKYMKMAIHDAIPKAFDFIRSKYGDKFDDVIMVFQPYATRSRYYSNATTPHPKWGSKPVVTISCKSILHLYEKKSIGDYKTEINVGSKIQIACSLIHELTHHAQYLERRIYSEVETTKNELEFIRIQHPDWYKIITNKI